MRKIAEIIEDNGQLFVQFQKELPKKPQIMFVYNVKTSDGTTSNGKFLIPGNDYAGFHAKLEKFIKRLGGVEPRTSIINHISEIQAPDDLFGDGAFDLDKAIEWIEAQYAKEQDTE